MGKQREASPWWAGKMLFALGLLAWFIVSGLYDEWRDGLLYWVGQACIVTGAAINLFHFYLLKRKAGRLCQPRCLVTAGGWLRWVRHPMYLGEWIVIVGFAWTIANPIAVIPAVFYTWFISMLCQEEDLNNAEDFPAEYAAWSRHSKRLFPGVW